MVNYFEILRGVCLILLYSQQNEKKVQRRRREIFGAKVTKKQGSHFQKKKKGNISIVQAFVSATGVKFFFPKLVVTPMEKNKPKSP